jgi:hypothetical protein
MRRLSGVAWWAALTLAACGVGGGAGRGPAPRPGTATAIGRSAALGSWTLGPGTAISPLGVGEGGRLASQLALARRAALRYPVLADAVRAGFVEATGYVPGLGAHYMKFSRIGGLFDPAQPQMLLYGGDSPDSPVVGLAYYLISGVAPPDGYSGSFDAWHQHRGVCVTRDGPVFASDAAQQCRLGGTTAWMLHAWVVPGYASPDGVFSAENVTVHKPGEAISTVSLACQRHI